MGGIGGVVPDLGLDFEEGGGAEGEDVGGGDADAVVAVGANGGEEVGEDADAGDVDAELCRVARRGDHAVERVAVEADHFFTALDRGDFEDADLGGIRALVGVCSWASEQRTGVAEGLPIRPGGKSTRIVFG